MFQHSKRRFQIFLAIIIIINFAQLIEYPLHGFHDFKTEQIIKSLQTTNSDTLIHYIKGFQIKYFFFLFDIIEAKCGLYKDCLFGIGEVDDFIE